MTGETTTILGALAVTWRLGTLVQSNPPILPEFQQGSREQTTSFPHHWRRGRPPLAPSPLCDTEPMPASADPRSLEPKSSNTKSVKVNLTTGTGMDIEWQDGHLSHYSFIFLRDACPCALCEDERGKTGRIPGEEPKPAPGSLPMFKPAAKPVSAEGVGKYAIKFHWNDGHELGIYSWQFLRDWCPCAECQMARAAAKVV